MKRTRQGLTLVEVLLAVVILCVAALGLQMLAPVSATRSVYAASQSRSLAAALRMSRQSAISTRSNVRLRLLGNAGQITGYTVERNIAGSFVTIAPIQSIEGLPMATSNTMAVTFAPSGAADVSLQVRLGTGRQTHQVSVIMATGQVAYVKS